MTPAFDKQVDVTIYNMQQREQLIDRLTIVRLIEQLVQLRPRCAQSSDNFPF